MKDIDPITKRRTKLKILQYIWTNFQDIESKGFFRNLLREGVQYGYVIYFEI